MKIKPLFDRIIVKEINEENITKSGLILPTSTQEKPVIAQVVAVGEGGCVDGDNVKIIINVNDKIIFHKYSASEFELENEKFLILKQCDILARFE